MPISLPGFDLSDILQQSHAPSELNWIIPIISCKAQILFFNTKPVNERCYKNYILYYYTIKKNQVELAQHIASYHTHITETNAMRKDPFLQTKSVTHLNNSGGNNSSWRELISSKQPWYDRKTKIIDIRWKQAFFKTITSEIHSQHNMTKSNISVAVEHSCTVFQGGKGDIKKCTLI